MNIDEKKILEFCDWFYDDTGGMWGHKDGKSYAVFAECFNGKPPNIYSLDWQKEYLWGKIEHRGMFMFWDGGLWCCDLEQEIYKEYHKDLATAILKAVMELIEDRK